MCEKTRGIFQQEELSQVWTEAGTQVKRCSQCWLIMCAGLCENSQNQIRRSQTGLTGDCATGGVCSGPADQSNGPQTTSCSAQYWKETVSYKSVNGLQPLERNNLKDEVTLATHLQSLMTWWMSNSKAASKMLSRGSGTLLESRNMVRHDCKTNHKEVEELEGASEGGNENGAAAVRVRRTCA